MFKQAVEQIIKENEKIIIVSAVVKEITGDSFTAEREGLADLLEVRLNSVLIPVKDYVKVVPKVGSVVLLGIIENNKSNAVLLTTSEIEIIDINIGNNSLVVDKGGSVFNNGILGGLVVSAKVAFEINALKAELSSLKQIFANWIPQPTDGGAILKTAIKPWADKPIVSIKKQLLENPKVKH